MKKRIALVLLAAVTLVLVQAGPAHVHQVINTIISDASQPDAPAREHLLDEEHINAYLGWQLDRRRPPGVREFSIRLLGDDRFSTFARVDLEEAGVADELPGLMQMMLTGDQDLEVEGHLETQDGHGRYLVESASLSGVPIPAFVVNAMIRRAGANLSPPVDPTERFTLPFRIQEVRIEAKKLTVRTGQPVAAH